MKHSTRADEGLFHSTLAVELAGILQSQEHDGVTISTRAEMQICCMVRVSARDFKFNMELSGSTRI